MKPSAGVFEQFFFNSQSFSSHFFYVSLILRILLKIFLIAGGEYQLFVTQTPHPQNFPSSALAHQSSEGLGVVSTQEIPSGLTSTHPGRSLDENVLLFRMS